MLAGEGALVDSHDFRVRRMQNQRVDFRHSKFARSSKVRQLEVGEVRIVTKRRAIVRLTAVEDDVDFTSGQLCKLRTQNSALPGGTHSLRALLTVFDASPQKARSAQRLSLQLFGQLMKSKPSLFFSLPHQTSPLTIAAASVSSRVI